MARFTEGYVRWYRRAFFDDIGTNIHCLGLWVALLSIANWKQSSIIWNGERRVLQPGEMVLGLREFSEKLGCSKNTIARWLDYLRRTDRIAVDHGPRGTLVTILNWGDYQGQGEDDGTEAGQKRDANGTPEGHDTPPTVGRQVTLSEEVKKGRRKKIAGTPSPAPAAGIYPAVDEILATRGVKAEVQLRWSEAYPDPSWVTQKILDASAWEASNPTKKKKNFAAFISRWLAKDWDLRRTAASGRQTINTTPLRLEDIA